MEDTLQRQHPLLTGRGRFADGSSLTKPLSASGGGLVAKAGGSSQSALGVGQAAESF